MLPLSSELRDYADEVVAALRAAGLRAELDARDEKVGRKIHDAEVQKVPVMLVLGGREAEARTVSVRRHGGVDVGVKPLDEVVAELAAEASERRLTAPATFKRARGRPPVPALPGLAYRASTVRTNGRTRRASIHLMRTSFPRVFSDT